MNFKNKSKIQKMKFKKNKNKFLKTNNTQKKKVI